MRANGIAYNRFDVAGLPLQQQLLAYWEQLGQVIEVVPSHEQLRQPFICINDRYDIGEFRMRDTYTDDVVIEPTMETARDAKRPIAPSASSSTSRSNGNATFKSSSAQTLTGVWWATVSSE